MAITLIKYIPQLVQNASTKSTIGFSIIVIFQDFLGGVCSLLQMAVDCVLLDSMSPIADNPVKFGLGLTSLAFDVCFFIQHYHLYPRSEEYVTIPSSHSTIPHTAGLADDLESSISSLRNGDGANSATKLKDDDETGSVSSIAVDHADDALQPLLHSRHASYESIL